MFLFTFGGNQNSGLNLLNTPILFEGDSNTDPNYSTVGWAKRALMHSGGRYYLPAGGNYANAGGSVSTAGYGGGGSMESSLPTVVARIQTMVSKFGRCVVWFQIGTNNGVSLPNDQAMLTNIVTQYRAAGAKVYANTCPTFGANNGYINGINTWIKTSGNVDGYVDVNLGINGTSAGSGDGTHYNANGAHAAGLLAGNYLASLAVTDSIYTSFNSSITDGTMAGTSGTNSTGSSGQVATGWTAQRNIGDGTIVCSKTTLDGKTAQRLVVNGGANGVYALFYRGDSYNFSTGDVIDGVCTMQISDVTDNSTISHVGLTVSEGSFPQNAGAAIFDAANWNSPQIFRTYPVARTGSGTSIGAGFAFQLSAGKTATFTIADIRSARRETA